MRSWNISGWRTEDKTPASVKEGKDMLRIKRNSRCSQQRKRGPRPHSKEIFQDQWKERLEKHGGKTSKREKGRKKKSKDCSVSKARSPNNMGGAREKVEPQGSYKKV